MTKTTLDITPTWSGMTTRNLDITPTWSGLLPILVELAAGKIDSTPEASSTAWAELRRMARIADGVVEATRDEEPLRLHLSRAKFKFEFSALLEAAGRGAITMTWAYSDGTKGRSIGRVEDDDGDRFVVYVELDHVVTQEWVNEHFPSEHCQHDYDCCGGWYPHRGCLVGVDDIYATSVISQSFYLNI